MKHKFRLLICSASALMLSGCYTPLLVDAPSKISDEHKFVKSYVLGEKKTVTVGDPMVKVQDYWVENFGSKVAYPSISATIRLGVNTVILEENKRYNILGRVDFEGASYRVIELFKIDRLEHMILVANLALITSDGMLKKLAVGEWRLGNLGRVIPMPSDPTVSEPRMRIIEESVPVVKTTKGYENYELLYTGVSATGINLTYREFSPDGLARVAFFQNLTYEATAKSIAFKKFRIAVEAATSESITFTVLADGHRESPEAFR